MEFPRHIRRVTVLAAVSVLLATGSAVASAAAASAAATVAAGTGWIRLAHLSPNTPAVDVYLYSFGDSSAQLVLHHVGYGDVSPYEGVAAGEYTVAMRAAGAAPASKPVLSASVDVVAGDAYTVAGLGPESGLRLRVLRDDMRTPSGKALVRVIQASLRDHVVTVSYGTVVLAGNLAFGSVSSYQTVSPATAAIRVAADGGDASATVTLAAGSVHTLVVLDRTSGVVIDNLLDAAGSGVAPAGGAGTGLGGMAPRGPSSPLPWAAVIAAGLLLAIAGRLGLRRLSRART
jgi:hypothetical protein